MRAVRMRLPGRMVVCELLCAAMASRIAGELE
jgi:hypothetical protein